MKQPIKNLKSTIMPKLKTEELNKTKKLRQKMFLKKPLKIWCCFYSCLIQFMLLTCGKVTRPNSTKKLPNSISKTILRTKIVGVIKTRPTSDF